MTARVDEGAAELCYFPHAIADCDGGVCTLGFCERDRDDCNLVEADGCEIDLNVDRDNCGVCARDCTSGPQSIAACDAGECSLTCAQGFAHCDNDLDNGCETDTFNDVNNCLGCGTVCSDRPHASGRLLPDRL